MSTPALSRLQFTASLTAIAVTVFSKVRVTRFDPQAVSMKIMALVNDDTRITIGLGIMWMMMVMIRAGTVGLAVKLESTCYSELEQAVRDFEALISTVGLSISLAAKKPKLPTVLNLTRMAACFPENLVIIMFRTGIFGPGAVTLADSANAGTIIDKPRLGQFIRGVKTFHKVVNAPIEKANVGAIKAILLSRMVPDDFRIMMGFDGERPEAEDMAEVHTLNDLEKLYTEEDYHQPASVSFLGEEYSLGELQATEVEPLSFDDSESDYETEAEKEVSEDAERKLEDDFAPDTEFVVTSAAGDRRRKAVVKAAKEETSGIDDATQSQVRIGLRGWRSGHEFCGKTYTSSYVLLSDLARSKHRGELKSLSGSLKTDYKRMKKEKLI